MPLGKLLHSTVVRIGSVAALTDDERPLFVAPFDCTVKAVKVVVATTIADDATDYLTFDFQNKGSAGIGTDSLASFDTDTNGDAVDLTAFVPHDVGSLSNASLSKGESVSVKWTNTGGSGVALDELAVLVVYEAKPGLVGLRE